MSSGTMGEMKFRSYGTPRESSYRKRLKISGAGT
jgi:hypothetical protein